MVTILQQIYKINKNNLGNVLKQLYDRSAKHFYGVKTDEERCTRSIGINFTVSHYWFYTNNYYSIYNRDQKCRHFKVMYSAPTKPRVSKKATLIEVEKLVYRYHMYV